ncbi:MAG TPA: SOS response-associated peptidase [Candidatus Binatia bacterium]|jgi:putative SOS response-associated peptidase YedK
MCGRFVLSTPADALAAEFSASTGGLLLRPRYNIAPMQDIVVVRSDGGERKLLTMRWGLVPSWAKDPSIASKLLNARSETAATRPAFRDAVRRRRCIVPASGFYEWKKEGTRKQPWYFRPSQTSCTLAIAALWEKWKSPEGEWIETCCLLTTGANTVLAPVHDRMPVLLDREGVARWLDSSCTDPERIGDLLAPCDAGVIEGHAVSTAVNSVRNDDARNIEAERPAQEGLPF